MEPKTASTDDVIVVSDTSVRPFSVDVPQEAIADLQRRITAWRPPEREPVDDQSQGVQLATAQALASTGGRSTTGGVVRRG